MKKRVVISVNNNLAFDQRVHKMCDTLYSSGYSLFLIGNNLNGLPDLNRKYSNDRISLIFHKSFLLYAEFNIKLFFYLLFKVKKEDILLANDLDTLVPNYLISFLRGNKIIFDSHEYFSELPSVQGKLSQKVWRFLEKNLIKKVDKTITVSQGIKKEYLSKYNIDAYLIKNLPKKYSISTSIYKTIHPRKFIIYQGAINPFRGINHLILAMKQIDKVDLLVFGQGPMMNEYKALVKFHQLENKVFFKGNVSPEKLRTITPLAEFGVSLEENAGKSYLYSLPNKIFDYIQAEIPVLGTFLPENKAIVINYQVGTFIENHSTQQITDKINFLLNKGKEYYKDNLIEAKKELNWESQEQLIQEIFK